MFCPKSTKLKMLHKYTSKVGRRFHNSDSEPAIRTPPAKTKGKLEARQTDEYKWSARLFQVFSIKKHSGRKGHFEEKDWDGWWGESGGTQVVGNQRQPELRG